MIDWIFLIAWGIGALFEIMCNLTFRSNDEKRWAEAIAWAICFTYKGELMGLW